MRRVQLEATGWAFAGSAFAVIVLAAHWRMVPPLSAGWLATLAYLLISNVLLVRGLRHRRSARLGPANVVTMTRSTLVGLITGLVVASFTTAIAVVLLVALVIPALALDAVDGWVARRTGSTSELGARFDMEVDAFLLLALSAYVAQSSGVWVLAIGSMRYAFVVVGWALPWLRRPLPFRYWRKVVTAVAGIALAAAASGIFGSGGVVFVAAALLMLIESFGRDVVWLFHRRRGEPAVRPAVAAEAENVE